MTPPPRLWQVAVDAPIPQILTYKNELTEELAAGDSVIVPLGKRKADGILIGPADTGAAGEFELKTILEKHPERPRLPASYLEWIQWVARYYCYPAGQVAQLCFPPLKKTGRGSRKSPLAPPLRSSVPPELTAEQARVFSDIRSHAGFSVHLLQGVTGSGKTEVYLRLLQDCLERGKQGLVLVPEISLTPQLVERFGARFGPQVAVIHSHLTEREKTEQWWSVMDRQKPILIGARSALFCPLPDLGLIILDEEHEPSFKQEEKLKYHARDAAIMLAQKLNCPILFGSATPSLESWENAVSGKYRLHQMKSRVENRAMPEISVVDLRQKKDAAPKKDLGEAPFWLSPRLHQALLENYRNGHQAALFLNRRGVAQTVTCPACGDTRECPNCAVSLTLHGKNHLVCHYCDYHETRRDVCAACGDGEPQPIGLGTELVEEDLRWLFPEARIARADRDEITSREQLEDLIKRMENREIDFLVGTQMIAKGLDFPGLQLVGLVLADVGFNLPDFRASERTFQLITQVSGRAGRHVKPGEAPGQVIVQTYNPDHPTLQLALQGDYAAFADYELGFRRSLGYPPAGRLASLRIQGGENALAQKAALDIVTVCHGLKQKFERYAALEILGPAEAPMLKLRGQYRYHVLIKGKDPWSLVQFCQHVMGNQDKLPKKTRLIVDIDPMSLL